MDNRNDRYNFILLSYKNNRSHEENKEYDRLSFIYSDNKKYETLILKELCEYGYMEEISPLYKQNEEGNYVTDNQFNTYWVITELGVKAITQDRFDSESKRINKEKGKEKRDRIWAIGILVIGYILGFISKLLLE